MYLVVYPYCRMDHLQVHFVYQVYPAKVGTGPEINTAHWIKNPLKKTSKHNHRYNYLNL